MTSRGILLLFIAFAAVGCGKPDGGPLREPPAAPTSDEAIPVGPVSGKVLGDAFTVKSARYYVDQRPGYQKTLIYLYGVETPTPCEDLIPLKSTALWLRHDGPEHVAPATTSIDLDGKAAWQLHYQVHEDGRWIGVGAARALFVITAVDNDMKIHGELGACFKDATGSCVSGRFTANYCRIWIDSPVRGADGMEPVPKVLPPPPPPLPSASASAAPAPSAEPPR